MMPKTLYMCFAVMTGMPTATQFATNTHVTHRHKQLHS